MKIKPTLLKTLLVTLVISPPALAFESNAALRVAVAKHAMGTNDIVKGDFSADIKKLNRLHNNDNSFFSNMSLCVVYLQSDDIKQPESTCTAAINSAEEIKLKNDKVYYLKSLSYNNRGISRYINHDISGALADLNVAVLIDNNAITASNLKMVRLYSYNSESIPATSVLLAE